MDYKLKYLKYKIKYFNLKKFLNINKNQINFDKVLIYQGLKNKEQIKIMDKILKKDDFKDNNNIVYCSNDLKYEIKLLNDEEIIKSIEKRSKCTKDYDKEGVLEYELNHKVYGLYINKIIVLVAILHDEYELNYLFESSIINKFLDYDITDDYNIIDLKFKNYNLIKPEKKKIKIKNYISILCTFDLLIEEKKKIKIINNLKNIKLFRYMLDYFKSIVEGNLYLIGYNDLHESSHICKNTLENKKLLEYYKNNNFKKTKFYEMVCFYIDDSYFNASFTPLLELENN